MRLISRTPRAMALRRHMPLALLCGLAQVLTGCAARDAAPDAAALRESLASTRASLAALDAGPDRQPAPAVPVAAVALRTPVARPMPSDRLAAWPPAGATPRRGGTGPPPAEAAQLMGLPAEAVTRWLGEPALRRPEGPAEIWLYTGASCALDVILYRDGAQGELRVAYAAARASGTERRAEAACLNEIAGGGRSVDAPDAGGAVSGTVRPRDGA